MKRFWIIVLAVAMALVVALPAGAGKPPIDCDRLPNHPECADPEPSTTTVPGSTIDCTFTATGVLIDPTSRETITLCIDNTSHRCRLTASPSDSFEFTIGTVDGATALLQPMIAITDAYPFHPVTCASASSRLDR